MSDFGNPIEMLRRLQKAIQEEGIDMDVAGPAINFIMEKLTIDISDSVRAALIALGHESFAMKLFRASIVPILDPHDERYLVTPADRSAMTFAFEFNGEHDEYEAHSEPLHDALVCAMRALNCDVTNLNPDNGDISGMLGDKRIVEEFHTHGQNSRFVDSIHAVVDGGVPAGIDHDEEVNDFIKQMNEVLGDSAPEPPSKPTKTSWWRRREGGT